MNLISKLYGSIFFFLIFRVFSPDFSSAGLEEFFFDSFRGFGARTNLITYLQPRSEFMALAPFDFMNFTQFPHNLVFEFIQN
jgi:hypothetical protein